MKALTFTLQGQPYGVPIEPVREIIGLGDVTPVPRMPAFLRGVMNLRGSVVPVIDLAQRLGLGSAADSERSCILLVDCPGDDEPVLVGVLVDAVQEVLRVGDDAIAPAPGFGTAVAAPFIQGIVQHEGCSMVVLALQRVLALDELEAEVDPDELQAA